MFAVFADDCSIDGNGTTLINIRTSQRYAVLTPNLPSSYFDVELTLCVQIMADTGRHVLSFISGESEQTAEPSEFEILPEHGNMYTHLVTQTFPLRYELGAIFVNAVPIYLDGVYLTRAYIAVHSL
jgi:hypothetical protein